MIARSVHYLSGGEEEEEERLACRIPTDREEGAEREIFRARPYNYDVARYILLPSTVRVVWDPRFFVDNEWIQNSDLKLFLHLSLFVKDQKIFYPPIIHVET